MKRLPQPSNSQACGRWPLCIRSTKGQRCLGSQAWRQAYRVEPNHYVSRTFSDRYCKQKLWLPSRPLREESQSRHRQPLDSADERCSCSRTSALPSVVAVRRDSACHLGCAFDAEVDGSWWVGELDSYCMNWDPFASIDGAVSSVSRLPLAV